LGTGFACEHWQFLNRVTVAHDEPTPPSPEVRIELVQTAEHKSHPLVTSIW
jgi:hypothetical protein